MMVAEQLIDGRVIEACQQGDRAAFQLLFETYKDKVFSIAVYSSGGDRAVQDGCTDLVHHREGSIASARSAGWLQNSLLRMVRHGTPVLL